MLRSKSIVELRGIAQAFGVTDIFQKDVMQLAQAIEMKQQETAVTPKIEVPKPEYDARLMTKAPSRKSDEMIISALLAPYIDRGLKLSFDPERWYMSFGKKTDEGTLRMPPRTVLHCAAKVME